MYDHCCILRDSPVLRERRKQEERRSAGEILATFAIRPRMVVVSHRFAWKGQQSINDASRHDSSRWLGRVATELAFQPFDPYVRQAVGRAREHAIDNAPIGKSLEIIGGDVDGARLEQHQFVALEPSRRQRGQRVACRIPGVDPELGPLLRREPFDEGPAIDDRFGWTTAR